MRITNGRLYTMNGQVFERGYVDFENGKITAFGDAATATAFSGETFDADGGYILPGLIDAHTHLGISEAGLRWEGADYNEMTDPVTPDMRALDGFYPFDSSVEKSLAGGVTSCAVSPGSANVIGGQIAAVKLVGSRVDDMIIKAPNAMKFALGENPKNCYGQSGKHAPMTRMGSAALAREALEKARRYMEKDDSSAYDPKCEALKPVLRREIPAQFHAHRSDDILTAMRIAHEFNLRYTIIHATDSAAIMRAVKDEGIIPMVGPSLGPASKPETLSVSFATAGRLNNFGIEVAITTDHDVMPLWLLPVFAGLCVREGMDEGAAMRAITINAAKAAEIDDRVGSIEKGKDADIAVFSGHPFELMTKTSAVFVDGKRVH